MAWQSSLTAILRAFRPASAPLPSISSPITRLRWLILPCVSWVRPASRSTRPCNATTATCAQVSPIPQWMMPPLLLLGDRYWKDNEDRKSLSDATRGAHDRNERAFRLDTILSKKKGGEAFSLPFDMTGGTAWARSSSRLPGGALTELASHHSTCYGRQPPSVIRASN